MVAKQGTTVFLKKSHSLLDPNLKDLKQSYELLFTQQKVHKHCMYNPLPLTLWRNVLGKNLALGFSNLKEKQRIVLGSSCPIKYST